jgi:cobalt transporter subunit CbtB
VLGLNFFAEKKPPRKLMIQANPPVSAVGRTETIVPAVLALLLGAFLIAGVGFAHLDVVHNAAHDARHAFAFPCH